MIFKAIRSGGQTKEELFHLMQMTTGSQLTAALVWLVPCFWHSVAMAVA
jgi:hypothetical protein